MKPRHRQHGSDDVVRQAACRVGALCQHLGILTLFALAVGLLLGCPSCDSVDTGGGAATVSDGDVDDGGGDNGSPLSRLQVVYHDDPDDPLLARVRSGLRDDEFTVFVHRDEEGNPTGLWQVHVRLSDGGVVVAILDDQGRPVRFESEDESIIVIYDGPLAMLLVATPDGDEAGVEVDLGAGIGGEPGEASNQWTQPLDRFEFCRLLEPYLQVTDLLFACDGTEPAPQCGGLIADGATGPSEICDPSLELRTVERHAEWNSSLEPQPVEPAVFAAARTSPAEVGTMVRLAAVALGGASGGTFTWEVVDGPVTPSVPAGRTSAVLLWRPGQYNVAVTFRDADGQSVSSEVTVAIDPLPPDARAGPDQAVQIGEDVLFDAVDSFDPDGELVSYDWDFGDGSTGTGLEATHRYDQAGEFEVTLSVTDETGLSDSDTLTVLVAQADIYTLTIEVQGQGTTSPPAGETALAANAIVQIIATSAEDWRFVRFEGDAAGTNPTTLVIANRDLHVTAVFEPVQPGLVTLEVLVWPPGSGSVVVEPEGDPAGVYPPGTELTVTAVANQGFAFSRYDGGIVSANPVATLVIEDDSIVGVAFVQGQTFSLDVVVQPPGGGVVVLIPPGGVYPVGSTVDVIAIPSPDFAFTGFYGDATGATPMTVVVMDQDRTVGAQFTSTLTVTQITQQPLPAPVACDGLDAEFSIAATGTALTFTWQRDCEPDGIFEQTIFDDADFDIAETGTTSTVTVLGVDASDECDYRCVVSGAGGDAVSSVVPLTVTGGLPVITGQPSPPLQTVCPGSNVAYTVTASGYGPLGYQWFKDGALIPGAISATLVLLDVQSADSGSFTCEVTDDCGTTASAPAVLNVQAELRFEANTVLVDGTAVEVALANTYCFPVVVCTVQYTNNTVPVVPRVSQVDQDSFYVRLQNPSGGAVVADVVHYLVVEEGIWSLDGVNFEAWRYDSTVTDRSGSHVGQAQVYGQAYVAPVVVGQVMSENDPDWSVFWSRGPGATSPPDAATLFTGKNVCEDADTDRATEVVGFIVFEAGHSILAGVDHEAALGPDTVQGVDNGAPFVYTFGAPFVGPAPAVAITAQAGMDGGNGSWSYVYNTAAATLSVAVDEDQIGDAERSHTTEQVAYVVFETPVVYPP